MIFNTNRSYFSTIKLKKMSEVTTTKTIDELVMAIPAEEVVKPTIPVDVVIKEASELHAFATEDKNELLAKGATEEMIADLSIRSRFLLAKQNNWLAVYQSSLTNTQEWSKKIEEGRLLQRELHHDFQFALRKNAKALQVLQATLDGDRDSDTIVDLSSYPEIAKQYPEELEAIKFDQSKLVKAASLAEELLSLQEKVDGVKNSSDRPEKQIRDRAYTYLKQLVDEIRSYGKYAFWNNEEKQKRYASEYLRMNTKKYIQKNEDNL